jgi:hypothetical protein
MTVIRRKHSKVEGCKPSMLARLCHKQSISQQYIWKAYCNRHRPATALQEVQWLVSYLLFYFPRNMTLIGLKQSQVEGCKPSMLARLCHKLSISQQYIWKAYCNRHRPATALQEVQWPVSYLLFYIPRNMTLIGLKQSQVEGCKPSMLAGLCHKHSISQQYI